MLNSVCLEQAMDMVVRVKEKNRVTGYRTTGLGSIKTGSFMSYSKGPNSVSNYQYGPPTSPPVSRNWSTGSTESQASLQSPKTVSTSLSIGEIRRLTEKELQEKRAKGLCY